MNVQNIEKVALSCSGKTSEKVFCCSLISTAFEGAGEFNVNKEDDEAAKLMMEPGDLGSSESNS